MKPVQMWAVMDGEEAINAYSDEFDAESYCKVANMFFNSDRYTVKRVTVTLEEKEKGE